MNDAIRETIKDHMHHERITQRELAGMAGMNTQYVWDVLNGKSGNTPKSWVQILDTLGFELMVKPKKATSPDSSKQKTSIEEKLEQLTTLHGEEWLLDRLEVLAALEKSEG